MFGFSKKERIAKKLIRQIQKDGVDHAAHRFSEIIIRELAEYESISSNIFEGTEVDAAYCFITYHIDMLQNISARTKELLDIYNIFPNGLTIDPDNIYMLGTTPTVVKANVIIKGVLEILYSDKTLMAHIYIKIIDKIIDHYGFRKDAQNYKINRYMGNAINGSIYLEDSEVYVLFIVNNDKTIYINPKINQLSNIIKYGKIANFIFKGRKKKDVIEAFILFDKEDSYSLFTLHLLIKERFDYISQDAFNYLSAKTDLFSPRETYDTTQIYAFTLLSCKDDEYYMVNQSNTKNYLISRSKIQRG